MALTNKVEGLIASRFGNNATEVKRILETYGSENWHRETERVHCGIIELSKNNIANVIRLTEEAKLDCRNILYWLTFDEIGNPPPLPTFHRNATTKVPPDISDELRLSDVQLKILTSPNADADVVAINPSHQEIEKHVFSVPWNDMTFITAYIDDANWLDGSGSLDPSDGLSGSCCIGGRQYVTEIAPKTLDEIVELIYHFVERDGQWRTIVTWT